ncbi:MAG: phosphohydrolase [candidate division Zixibacteria bacterium CG_4_9_14_3_um_filter_46_8]|nr:MAG: phosphohydrolase [candidate division Zixibacteria bacterium CG_4_9_14_3_um_filter_46_8]
MDRNQAIELVRCKISSGNLRKHILSVEAVMRRLALHFHEDIELWGMTGLLHDLDYEETVNNPDRHTLITEQWLDEYKLDSVIIRGIKAHAGKVVPSSLMEKAIFAADPVTGLIVAAALMHPSKKLAGVDLKFLKKRFKEKRFAAGARREDILTCEQFGLTLDEFMQLSLEGMQAISDDLGF